MKRLSIISLLLIACAHLGYAKVSVTPFPASMMEKGGAPFVIGKATTLLVEAPAADSLRIVGHMRGAWPEVKAVSKRKGSQIRFILEAPADSASEAYTLRADKSGVSVTARSGAGLFYGLQTLLQLGEDGKIPPVVIEDSPRFSYRGMLLDVSRHFRDKEFVKKQIDAMARLKINRLHLHLTDAAGWRLQVDRYPQLTGLAAWRDGETWKEWNANGNRYLPEGDPKASGGYYTKDDIREILDYAADRYMTVIPEIEMPSHSEEAIAAYPLLGCTKAPYTTSDFCPGSETTYEFLENVLDEVVGLFPSKYIHIGGDEAPKTKWHDCPDCQARIGAESLKDVDELQSYLVRRIERHLNSRGRALIGWDEIMEGGISPTATVVAWRGADHGINAAKAGNDVVMAPGKYLYFDGYQDAPHTQPEAIGGFLPLEGVYAYDPVPDSIPAEAARHIIGLEGTLFTEYIPTPEHAEYMLWPRAIALAEVGWTPQTLRDFGAFRPRAEKVAADMRRRGYITFDLASEVGNRPEARTPVDHKGLGKRVTYNVPWWRNYNAAFEATLTDGLRGGWTYSDQRWQGFLYRGKGHVDVTVDLEKEEDISYVGADFMQICGPGVYMPDTVRISVSSDGQEFTLLEEIENEVVTDDGVSFKTFSWSGSARARYVRYEAVATHGVLFTDEIIIR